MSEYKLFQSSYIKNNQQSFIEQSIEVKNLLDSTDTTKDYYRYNLFSITAGSIYFYNLFAELRDIIRSEIPDKPLWIQSWVNLHEYDKVLDWHNHSWPYHGYISIDPKRTVTEFEEYSISNHVGQIYFGPGNRLHRVKVLEKFEGLRITIGYDVTDDPIMHTGCLGLIPLL